LWRKIYDLRDDKQHIVHVQQATLHSDDFGLVPEHGLFGSEEWWSAIKQGHIPTHVLEGTISDVFWSGHNDFPEFEMTSGSEKSRWERMGDENRYVEGSPVRITYVKQKFKKPILDMTHDRTVLIVEVSSAPSKSGQDAEH